MRRVVLFISLLFAGQSYCLANPVKENLDAVQQNLTSGPDSEFHKGAVSDTFAAALKNPFLAEASANDNWIRMVVFFSVLSMAIFLRIWKNSVYRKERESQQ